MKKRRCQGVLIENEFCQNDGKDAFVCIWCGTTYDRKPGIDADDRCRARFLTYKPVRGLIDQVCAASAGARSLHEEESRRGGSAGLPRGAVEVDAGGSPKTKLQKRIA
jgi:hypothetical protein